MKGIEQIRADEEALAARDGGHARVGTGSLWSHRKTKRPAKVVHGNEPLAPVIVAGSVIGGVVPRRVTYRYTDRTTRVMPCEMDAAKFVQTFQRRTR